MKNVLLAVEDLLQLNDFYPEDMPLEWYLDYYLNEFDSVLITPTILKELDLDEEELVDTIQNREENCNLIVKLCDFDESKLSKQKYVNVINSKNDQGVDDFELIKLNLASYKNVKKLSDYCIKSINKDVKITTVLIVSTPISYKQFNELQILLDLLY